jgi:hypothetical protein
MKRLLTFLITIISICLLASCDPAGYYFDAKELKQNIVSIELIEYKNDKQDHFISWVPNHMDDLLPMNLENITNLKKLDESRIESFIDALSNQYILYKYYSYNSPRGLSIKMNYCNGNYIIISYDHENTSFSGYIGIYTSKGEVSDYIGCFSNYDSYKFLVNYFFEMNI